MQTKTTSLDKTLAALAENGWDTRTKERQVAVPIPGTTPKGLYGRQFGARAERTVVDGVEVTFSGMSFYGPVSGVLRFTAEGRFCRDLSSAFGWQSGGQSLTDILRDIERKSPLAAAARKAEDEAKTTAERVARNEKLIAQESAASAARTKLQNEVYNLVINAASAREVTGVNTSAHFVRPEPKDIAVEIVCLLQQDDSPLLALVDAYRAHIAAQDAVRATVTEALKGH